LSQEMLYRSKKGFGVPIGKWFQRGDLMCLPLSNDTHLSTNFIETAIKSHMSGKVDQRAFLWNAYLISFMPQ